MTTYIDIEEAHIPHNHASHRHHIHTEWAHTSHIYSIVHELSRAHTNTNVLSALLCSYTSEREANKKKRVRTKNPFIGVGCTMAKCKGVKTVDHFHSVEAELKNSRFLNFIKLY